MKRPQHILLCRDQCILIWKAFIFYVISGKNCVFNWKGIWLFHYSIAFLLRTTKFVYFHLRLFFIPEPLLISGFHIKPFFIYNDRVFISASMHLYVCMCVHVYEWRKGTDRMQRRDEVIHLNELHSTAPVTSRCWLRCFLIDPKWDGSQERPCLPCRCYIQLCSSKQAVFAACVHQPGTKGLVSSFPRRES